MGSNREKFYLFLEDGKRDLSRPGPLNHIAELALPVKQLTVSQEDVAVPRVHGGGNRLHQTTLTETTTFYLRNKTHFSMWPVRVL